MTNCDWLLSHIIVCIIVVMFLRLKGLEMLHWVVYFCRSSFE